MTPTPLSELRAEHSIPILNATYRCGTLHYTGRQLLVLCAALLCGDFCVTVFESVFGPFMPLYLKDLGAPSAAIAALTTGLAGLMNLLFLPNISIWTDRTRTRWGRRIPFLLWSAPGAAAALLLIAYAPDLSRPLHASLVPVGGLSLAMLTLGMLAVLISLWHFFNLVLINVYNFLLRDVVPLEVMPRFLAAFRIVGTAGHFAFQWFLFAYLLEHPKRLFIGVGGLFLLAFAIVCWRVREGEYPSPAPEKPALLRSFLAYFREGLSIPLYRQYFLVYGLMVFGSSAVAPFVTLFARHSIGLSMDRIGKVAAGATLASALLFLPAGRLCERFDPFRVALWALVGGACMRLVAFFFVHGESSWLVYSLLNVIPSVAWNLASFSATMALFPAEKFGQFSSGLNVLGYGSLVLTSSLVGWLIGLLHDDYRIAFAISFICYALALVPMARVHRGWKRHGGPRHYVPPLPQ